LEFNKLLSGLSYKGKIFWVDAPLYYHSNRGLPDMCKKLSSVTPHPLILYNNPRIIDKVKGPFNRRNIRTSVLKELSLIEEVVGLIYIGDLRRALNYQNAVRIRSNFRIYDADEELFLNFPNKSGLVSISANLIPHIWKQMLDLYSDNPKHLSQIWNKGNILADISRAIKIAPAPIIKGVLKRKGLLESDYCWSRVSYDQEPISRIEKLLSIL
jgi:dihydrodipicolinate synthase/N-acetylneuraminate lyase